MEEEHADDVVPGPVHAREVHEGVKSGSEGAVQPATSLSYELSRAFRDIGLAFCGFDVCEMPFVAGFRNQFET